MTWRMALDRQRSNRRRSTREVLNEDQGHGACLETRPALESADQVMEARERAQHLWVAIEELPEKLRLVVVLAGIEGHDMREVAALLSVPEGTVKSRLFLARRQLKERLSWMVTHTSR
jgi:RNA polymerase sigma-70 factor (ECF subfamily)